MPFKSSGSIGFDEIKTYFGTSNPVSLGSFYRGASGSPIQNSTLNSSIPTSGEISASNFYNSYKLSLGPSLEITPGTSTSGGWIGYQEGSALISDPQIGSMSVSPLGSSNPYTDGEGSSRRVSGALYNISTSTLYFKTATSSTTNNDAGFYRIWINGYLFGFGSLFRSSAATSGMLGTPGVAQYGRYWTFSCSNPFQIGYNTLIDVEFLS